MLFRGEQVNKRISVLSGGERRGFVWPDCCWGNTTCWCSTSRGTTSMSKRSKPGRGAGALSRHGDFHQPRSALSQARGDLRRRSSRRPRDELSRRLRFVSVLGEPRNRGRRTGSLPGDVKKQPGKTQRLDEKSASVAALTIGSFARNWPIWKRQLPDLRRAKDRIELAAIALDRSCRSVAVAQRVKRHRETPRSSGRTLAGIARRSGSWSLKIIDRYAVCKLKKLSAIGRLVKCMLFVSCVCGHFGRHAIRSSGTFVGNRRIGTFCSTKLRAAQISVSEIGGGNHQQGKTCQTVNFGPGCIDV